MNNLLLFNVITIVFYFLVIILIIILLKFNWYNIIHESEEEKILPRKNLRLLFLAVAILSVSIFFGLYHPTISITAIPSLFEGIIDSVIVGGIIYALIYLTMRFLLNHPYTLTGHGKKSVLLLIVLILPALFSYQSVIVVKNNDISIYNLPFGTKRSAVTSDFSKAAFIALGQNQRTTYLMIQNLHTKQIQFYKLCDSSQNCLEYYQIDSVQFYNDNSIIIKADLDGYGLSFFTFNLLNSTLSFKGTFPYSQFTNVANPIITVNSTPYWVKYEPLTQWINVGNNGELQDYIRLNITNCLNNQTNSIKTNYINDSINIIKNPRIAISSEFSTLAFYESDQVVFYSLSGSVLNFLTNMTTPSLLNNFHFISTDTNTTAIYFSSFNATSTEIYTFNYSTNTITELLQIPNGLFVSAINEKESLLLTKTPSNWIGPNSSEYSTLNYQLYEIESRNNVKLLQNESADVLQTSNNLKNLVTEDNAKNVMLMSYDYSNNTLTKQSILFNEKPNNYLNIGLLKQIQSFSLLVAFLALISTIGILVVDFYFNLD